MINCRVDLFLRNFDLFNERELRFTLRGEFTVAESSILQHNNRGSVEPGSAVTVDSVAELREICPVSMPHQKDLIFTFSENSVHTVVIPRLSFIAEISSGFAAVFSAEVGEAGGQAHADFRMDQGVASLSKTVPKYRVKCTVFPISPEIIAVTESHFQAVKLKRVVAIKNGHSKLPGKIAVIHEIVVAPNDGNFHAGPGQVVKRSKYFYVLCSHCLTIFNPEIEEVTKNIQFGVCSGDCVGKLCEKFNSLGFIAKS